MTRPPSPAALERAFARLPRDITVSGALHLALPLNEIPSVSVRHAGGRYSYRQATCHAGAPPAAVAARLAALGHRSQDQYLDLDGDPLSWLKVLRSGARQVAFGVELLFGGPRISLAADLPAAAADAALAAWWAGKLVDPPGLLATRWGHLLVGGSRWAWQLVGADKIDAAAEDLA